MEAVGGEMATGSMENVWLRAWGAGAGSWWVDDCTAKRVSEGSAQVQPGRASLKRTGALLPGGHQLPPRINWARDNALPGSAGLLPP